MRYLDPAQLAAAKGTAAVQLTLAGPGSGKTSTLTGRFIHLVSKGADPARILAMTYTKKAADEMRARIAKLLQLPSAKGLQIATFHAFTYRLLKRDPAAAGLPERFQLWGAPEQRHVFSSRRMWWNEDDDILDIIGGAKERMLDAAALEKAASAHDEVLRKAVPYFRVYEAALRGAGAIDFADMVPLVVRAMDRSETYRRNITGAYDHLLVDEYQDVNPGQIRLIGHFVDDNVKLWAVGDDDQTLYAFRASDVRYILEFATKYPGAQIHVLNRNYRSSPEIVEAAKRVIRHNQARCDKDYQPAVSAPGEIVIRGYSAPDIEARQVARAIGDLLENGYAPQQVAVLYRSGAVGLPFQTALKDLKIPFEVRGAGDVWQGAAAKLVVGALYYLREGESAEAMMRLGGGKRGEIVRDQLDQVKAVVRHDFTASCRHVQRIAGDAVPKQAASRERAEWVSLVDAVIALAQSCKSLQELEAKIAEQSRSLRNPPEHAVVLSTVHSAKGLEWDVVFLAGLEDGVLPHVNSDDIEEERRIAYVGVARAKRLLGLTYAAERYGEKSKPSPFLFELTGKEERLHIWTGPKLKGADDRVPLLSGDERRRQVHGGRTEIGHRSK